MICWRERMDASYLVLLPDRFTVLFIWYVSLVHFYIIVQYDSSDPAS
jgi:hypothetical protein